MLYLDHAASTYPYVEVVRLYSEEMRGHFANPSSAHPLGRALQAEIAEAKRTLARLLGCAAEELVQTSGATEAANSAIKGYIEQKYAARPRALPAAEEGPPQGEILLSAGEHPAVRASAAAAAERFGLDLRLIPLNAEGKADAAALEAALSARTALVCLIAVNNETGAVNDIPALARLIRRAAPRAKLFVDYVQAFCKMPVDLAAAQVDMACFSGHKVHGPKGVGLLFCRRGLRLSPLLHGGGHQQGRRSGTEDALALKGLALAAKLGCAALDEKRARVEALRAGLLERLAPGTFRLNSPADASPWILNLSFPGLRGESLMNALAGEQIYVGRSSACHSKAAYSEVLSAMRLDKARLESALRISFDAAQTRAEIERAAESINRLFAKYRL